MVDKPVPLPAVEHLSERVIRVLGGNPGKFTLQGTNTYILGTGPSRILIDTGEGKPAWLASIKSVLSSHSIHISRILLTHWHPDHINGVPPFLSSHPSTPVHKNSPTSGPGSDNTWLPITDSEVFSVAGATLRALHSPGHTTDHMAFILEEESALFTGDNVLGQGTAVFEDLATYISSLELMAKSFSGRAYPGHGPVIEDGPAKVREYIAHRKEREKQVLRVLASENKDGKDAENKHWWTSLQIVKVIYKDYPENLWEPAERGVLQILHKLLGEEKVLFDQQKDAWALRKQSAL